MSTDDAHKEPSPAQDAHNTDDDHGHGHDDHAVATDIIPESSPQDLMLKGVTIIAAILVIGTFVFWEMQPLPVAVEEHGGSETSAH